MKTFVALAILSLVALFVFAPPIPQPQAYHHFADPPKDVVSNAAFAIAGIYGLLVMRTRRAFVSARERRDALVFFAGTILTAIGSAIYHTHPGDPTLVYDRLGMVIAFMAFLAMMIDERYESRAWLLPLLLAFGVASIVWWRMFDDLRPYVWVQFFPMLGVIALVAWRRRYSGEVTALGSMFVAYAAAKVFELLDQPIYAATHMLASGHTLKHIVAACAAAIVAVWIARREAIAEQAATAAA